MTGSPSSNTIRIPVTLGSGHGFPQNKILALIKSSLNQIPGDPVPKSIRIENIRITQIGENNLEISCEVFYEN